MSAMYRLKAYFGMVPAEEMGDYAEETVGRPVRSSAADRRGDVRRGALGRPASPTTVPMTMPMTMPTTSPRTSRTWTGMPDRPGRPGESVDRGAQPRAGQGAGARGGRVRRDEPRTRGSLAIDTDARAGPAGHRGRARPGQRQPLAGAQALARITTLQPSSYNEARTIGERYRDGQPVIINLTELDDAAAKRLVDFAAGLAFALRGSIDKVTSRVFLLTPADVEVSAADARRLAERSVGGSARGRRRGASRPTRVEERGIFRQD